MLSYDRYYVLVAACVFARKSDWLRNACLAAALLFPAVAALHGIVLAAIHIEGAFNIYFTEFAIVSLYEEPCRCQFLS